MAETLAGTLEYNFEISVDSRLYPPSVLGPCLNPPVCFSLNDHQEVTDCGRAFPKTPSVALLPDLPADEREKSVEALPLLLMPVCPEASPPLKERLLHDQ